MLIVITFYFPHYYCCQFILPFLFGFPAKICYFSPLEALLRLDTVRFSSLSFFSHLAEEAASPVLKKLLIYVVTSTIFTVSFSWENLKTCCSTSKYPFHMLVTFFPWIKMSHWILQTASPSKVSGYVGISGCHNSSFLSFSALRN